MSDASHFTQEALCLLALAVALNFNPTPSLRPPLATFFLVEARPSALISALLQRSYVSHDFRRLFSLMELDS
ncbi:hypothetical protein TNCV_4423151 [Trichonephila clavipes]|nr:hypothetical protein TNCV_4423151 [Trichonephila clavipes]